MEYFTADTHYNFVGTLYDDNRPFKSIQEYNKHVIRDWNKPAKKEDTIYVVGDIITCEKDDGGKWKEDIEFIKKIKAKVVLIIGNNEERIIHYYFNDKFKDFKEYCLNIGFAGVYKDLVVSCYGKKFFLTHQAKDVNPKYINLFGHVHIGSGLYHPYGLCVSTDMNHFRLFTKDFILHNLDRKKKYWEPDDNLNYLNPFLQEIDGKIVNIKKKTSKVWQEYQKGITFHIDYTE